MATGGGTAGGARCPSSATIVVPRYRMARAQSPIKVHESTKDKIRYAALMAGLKQAELVELAVDEYVERHREEFGRRMDRAREALLGGKASALAYSADISEEDVERVGGVKSG